MLDPLPPWHEKASPFFVALESLIHNKADGAVVFPLILTPRVEICCVRELRAKGDERSVCVSTQNNSNGMLEKNDGNLRKHVLRRRSNYLLEKVQHENVILPIVRQHEVFEVVLDEIPVHRVRQTAITKVEGVQYRDPRKIISHDIHRHTERE